MQPAFMHACMMSQAVRSQQRAGAAGRQRTAACVPWARPQYILVPPWQGQAAAIDQRRVGSRGAGQLGFVGWEWWDTVTTPAAGRPHITCFGHGNLSGPRTMGREHRGRTTTNIFCMACAGGRWLWFGAPRQSSWCPPVVHCPYVDAVPGLASWLVPAGANKFRIDLSPSWIAARGRRRR
jgi:hypothetical protein